MADDLFCKQARGKGEFCPVTRAEAGLHLFQVFGNFFQIASRFWRFIHPGSE
jgi:hypothetical protein